MAALNGLNYMQTIQWQAINTTSYYINNFKFSYFQPPDSKWFFNTGITLFLTNITGIVIRTLLVPPILIHDAVTFNFEEVIVNIVLFVTDITLRTIKVAIGTLFLGLSPFAFILSLLKKEPLKLKDLENLSDKEALDVLKVTSLDGRYILSQEIRNYDLDNAKDLLDDNPNIMNIYQMCYFIDAYCMLTEDKKNAIEGALNHYFTIYDDTKRLEKDNLTPRQLSIASVIKKIFGFLSITKQSYVHEKDPALKQKIKEKYIRQARDFFDTLIDAHRNCIDQVLSQLSMVILRIVSNSVFPNTVEHVALAHLKYIDSLIMKICCSELFFNEPHQADLAQWSKKTIFYYIGTRPSKLVASGAEYPLISKLTNKVTLLAKFFFKYSPIEALLNQINYHQHRSIYNDMCTWYARKMCPNNSNEVDRELIKKIGGDPIIDVGFKFTREAKLYYLLKHKCIT